MSIPPSPLPAMLVRSRARSRNRRASASKPLSALLSCGLACKPLLAGSKGHRPTSSIVGQCRRRQRPGWRHSRSCSGEHPNSSPDSIRPARVYGLPGLSHVALCALRAALLLPCYYPEDVPHEALLHTVQPLEGTSDSKVSWPKRCRVGNPPCSREPSGSAYVALPHVAPLRAASHVATSDERRAAYPPPYCPARMAQVSAVRPPRRCSSCTSI